MATLDNVFGHPEWVIEFEFFLFTMSDTSTIISTVALGVSVGTSLLPGEEWVCESLAEVRSH